MTVGELKERLSHYPDDRVVVTYDDDGETLLEIDHIGYLGSKDGNYDQEMQFFDGAGNPGVTNLNKIVYIE